MTNKKPSEIFSMEKAFDEAVRKPRLFFANPVVALYMMQEFDVKFETEGIEELMVELSVKDLASDISDSDWNKPYYVCRESESIFEPQDGDFGIDRGGYFYNRHGKGWYIENQRLTKAPEHSIQIIMRDNKHFFNAIREER